MSQQKKKKERNVLTLTFSLGTKVEEDGGVSVGIANCDGGAASRLHSEGVAGGRLMNIHGAERVLRIQET